MVQSYGEAWVMLMLTVRVQVKWPGARVRLRVIHPQLTDSDTKDLVWEESLESHAKSQPQPTL